LKRAETPDFSCLSWLAPNGAPGTASASLNRKLRSSRDDARRSNDPEPEFLASWLPYLKSVSLRAIRVKTLYFRVLRVFRGYLKNPVGIQRQGAKPPRRKVNAPKFDRWWWQFAITKR
jgi:hypothetical protein